jgi:hypothetical protein
LNSSVVRPRKLASGEMWSAADEAIALLRLHPRAWLWVVIAFLLTVEALTLVPYFGFLLKTGMTGVIFTLAMAEFPLTERGEAPSVNKLFAFGNLPARSAYMLFLVSLIPLAASVLYLFFFSDPQAIYFFFGKLWSAHSPAPETLLHFKLLMYAVSVLFIFVPPAVVVGHYAWNAVRQGLWAARLNPQAVLFFLALFVGAELGMWAMSWLSTFAGMIVSLVVQVIVQYWSLAFIYALGKRVFAGG